MENITNVFCTVWQQITYCNDTSSIWRSGVIDAKSQMHDLIKNGPKKSCEPSHYVTGCLL